MSQARRGAVRLEVGGVDHEPIRHTACGRRSGKDAREHAEAAPVHEAIVERLVWAIARRRILPLQPIADDVDDAADDAAVIDANKTARAWKEWFDAAHLRGSEQNKIRHEAPPIRSESQRVEPCKGS